MRIYLLPLLLLAACHRPQPTPAATNPQASTAIKVAVAPTPVAVASAPSVEPADATISPPFVQPPPTPPLAGEGPFAFVVDASGLVEISTQGVTQVIYPAKIIDCSVDARAKVVWFRKDDALYTFDLIDRKIRQVLSPDDSGALSGEVIISWGREQLGGLSKVDYDVALQVTMTTPPKMEASIGCDGDRSYYCYGETYTAEHPTLEDSLAGRKAAIEEAKFVVPEYMVELSKRGASGSLWSAVPKRAAQAKKKPKIDKSQCPEDESRCGQLTAIPGTTFWKVIVGNSRGDFYSEDHSLWDSDAGQFVSVEGGKFVQSKTPESMADMGGMRVSTTGVLSFRGAIFDGKKLYYAPKGDVGMTCGWSNGGWRVSGVRER